MKGDRTLKCSGTGPDHEVLIPFKLLPRRTIRHRLSEMAYSRSTFVPTARDAMENRYAHARLSVSATVLSGDR
jgi:hypothetical protein